ncbi:hypothetical protein C8F04DRAFT_1402503 [Mycena alexandri]|uniref:Uncharacterized protein n=1 Tax=Mycena alexandri TaxID=1745969 RepID=A0AAD6S6J7_9AGAR|nr:hypothetical protein C8F04DRAFT_1402503 [Mycena alexandri]
MSNLSQELVDMVIDNVDLPKDLEALSLVSRPFVAGTQARIFRHLTLSSDTGTGLFKRSGTLPKLSAILSRSPHLGAYVRDLHINLDLGRSDIHVLLAPTLQLLKGVSRTAITYIRGCHWSWSSWTDEMRAALIDLLCLPTMRFLALVRCTDVPATIIRHAMASYEEVVLEVSGIDFHAVEFVRPSHGKSLKRLVLLLDYRAEDNPDFHDLMVSAELTASSAHLKHLDVDLLDDVDLVTKHAVSAEIFTMNCYYFPEFALPANPALRSVNINAHPRMEVIYTLREVLRFIARLPSAAPKLEFLAISIFGFGRDTWRSVSLPPSSDADDALMELLNLRNMRFSVGRKAPEFEERLMAALPRTVAAGRLLFPTDIEPPDRWDTTAFFSQRQPPLAAIKVMCTTGSRE